MAKMECPICKGTGKIHEDASVYEFITRDAITKRCLFCDGSGKIEARVKMPDGRMAFELKRQNEPAKRLNVSRKAVIRPEAVDTGLGYEPDRSNTGQQKLEKYETPRFFEMATNPRLNKVLASGKDFLLVTDTEPYYLDVYRMIRSQERKQGTWTADDEDAYVAALEKKIRDMQERHSYTEGRIPAKCKTTKEASNG